MHKNSGSSAAGVLLLLQVLLRTRYVLGAWQTSKLAASRCAAELVL